MHRIVGGEPVFIVQADGFNKRCGQRLGEFDLSLALRAYDGGF